DPPGRAVLWCEKTRSTVATHLLCGPAHHLRRAGVPVGDVAVRVGQDHRKINGAVEDCPLTRLTAGEGRATGLQLRLHLRGNPSFGGYGARCSLVGVVVSVCGWRCS